MFNKNTMYLDNFATFYGINRREFWEIKEIEEYHPALGNNTYMLEMIEYNHILETVIY